MKQVDFPAITNHYWRFENGEFITTAVEIFSQKGLLFRSFYFDDPWSKTISTTYNTDYEIISKYDGNQTKLRSRSNKAIILCIRVSGWHSISNYYDKQYEVLLKTMDEYEKYGEPCADPDMEKIRRAIIDKW